MNKAKASSQEKNEASSQDRYNDILYALAKKAGECLESDMADLNSEDDTVRVKAKLRCEEDCQIMTKIWKIRNDNDITSLTTLVLEVFKKQRDSRRRNATIAILVLAALMLAGAVLSIAVCYKNAYQEISILIAEALCAGFLLLLLRHVMGAKDSDMNTAQVIEVLAAIRSARETDTVGLLKENAVLDLASKLFPNK